MKKKGLSFEEKRKRLLNIMHEKKEVMNLKELEKLGPKSGIVLQSVKEVLDSLCSDYLVEGDKIGSANFFWALPSRAIINLENQSNNLTSKIESDQSKIQELQLQLDQAISERQETEERNQLLQQFEQLKQEYKDNQLKLQEKSKTDPR